MTRAAAAVLQIRGLLAEVGMPVKLRVFSDSSAARGMVARSVLAKMEGEPAYVFGGHQRDLGRQAEATRVDCGQLQLELRLARAR